MPIFPTFAGLHNDLSWEVERHGGRLPERVALVWYGYLAALTLYELIPADEIAKLAAMLPHVEDNPVDALFTDRPGRSDPERAPKVGRKPGVPRSQKGDRFIDGVKTDYKSLPPGATASTVRNQISNAVKGDGEVRNFIFDATRTGMTAEEARRGIKRAMDVSRGKVDSVRVLLADRTML